MSENLSDHDRNVVNSFAEARKIRDMQNIVEMAQLRGNVRAKLGSLSLETLQAINALIAAEQKTPAAQAEVIELAGRRSDV